MSDEARVDVSVDNGIARLTLNNPTRKNALTLSMTEQIGEFCQRVETDLSIGAVIVDSAGNYFCSGADTRDLAASSEAPASPEAVARTSAVYGSFVRVGTLPVPTISLVKGGAVGAGLNLAMATDIMLVTPDVVLDSGFLARKIHPGGGHIRMLGRSMGYQQAVAMSIFGAALSGEDAVARGFAWAAVPAEELLDTALGLCRLPAADPELARRIKQSATIELDSGLSWAAAVEVERGVQMWSLGRKGSKAWEQKPGAPTTGR
ncbi:enoyl-CoA hydratase-related protein [Mycolicibacterium baixiangningiae]|uniref:enoyl-CoA hydratase-related protein n=1 Tax=Mycolicibacterium baixiangningiae TaxID=2761578 RepID=UPI001865F217|nr:enoyl-CoA hydratase-related protein [Mycolicibacterium baixiangningiae]